MRSFILASLCLAVLACGEDSTPNKMDAATGDGNNVDSSGGIDAAGVASCQMYCQRTQMACTGANQQYTNGVICNAVCPKMPVGMASDTGGNTLGCRFYHAGNAMTAPAAHCVHAGPAGGGVCGANCEGFCTLVTQICSAQYPNMATCMTQCGMFDQTTPYSSSITTGNSFACRMYHATQAAADAAVHCAHTAAIQTGAQDPCK